MFQILKNIFSDTNKRDSLIANLQNAYRFDQGFTHLDQKPLQALLNFYVKNPDDDVISQTLQKALKSTPGSNQPVSDKALLGFNIIAHMNSLKQKNHINPLSRFHETLHVCRREVVRLVEETLHSKSTSSSRNYDAQTCIWTENCEDLAAIDPFFGKQASEMFLRVRNNETEKSDYAKSAMTIFAVKHGERDIQIKALGKDPASVNVPHTTTLHGLFSP